MSKFNKQQIIHFDLDGCICGLYLYNRRNWEVKGVIDYHRYNKAVFVHATPLDSYVFIDIAINRKHYNYCIDHHYGQIEGKLNPHQYEFPIYKEIRKKYPFFTFSKDIKEKFPMSNIIWLLYLFKDNFDKYTIEQQQIIIAVDGTYKNWHNPDYRDNMTYWTELINMPQIIDIIKAFSFDEWQQIHRKYNVELVYDIKTKNWTHESYENLCHLAKAMNWKVFELPKVNFIYKLEIDKKKPHDAIEDDLFTRTQENSNDVYTSKLGAVKYVGV